MAMIRPETEMKDSGVEWIGDIPTNWRRSKLKYLGEYINGYAFKPADWSSKGHQIIRIQDLTGSNSGEPNYFDGILDEKYHVVNGDILVSWAATLDAFVWKKEDGWLNQHIFKAVPNEKIVKGYFLWLLKVAMDNMNNDDKHGIVMQHVTIGLFNNYVVPLAPYTEQQAIADYLDKTCSKIDEIIAEAKASINEYEKLKQATIDENMFGYDSVDIKLRQLGSLKNGLNFSHSDDVANIKFLGVGCFKDNMILSKVDDFADEHIDFEISEEYLLSNGDIVFVRSNGSKELVGRSIMVENIDYPVTFSGFCIRFRNMHTELVDNRFLLYYFRTTHFKQSLLKYSNDSTNINNLNQEMLNAIYINAPVINEQKLLVKKLEKQVFVIDSLISEKESLINDLEAYKKSLIYEVVTGKRRVV